MARVVQQRTAPPYLTIVFVFLFLVATTLAVLFYLQWDKAKTTAAENEQLLGQMANSPQRNSGEFQRMLNQPGKTVYGQMQEQIQQMSRLISGSDKPAPEAIDQAQQVTQQTNVAEGLAPQVAALSNQVAQRDQTIAKLNSDLAALQEQEAQQNKKVDELIAAQKTSLAGAQGEVTQSQQQLQEREQAHTQRLEAAQQEWRSSRGELENNLASATKELDETKRRLADAQGEIARLKQQIHPAASGEQTTAPRPDGRIIQTVQGDQYVYVNIGQANNVKPGQTFAVYPSSGIPENGQPKGKIVVTTVQPNISEARIINEAGDDPIIPDDLIANIAFDQSRTYKFALAGQFSLRGGEPTEQGLEEIKALIRQEGGQVVDKLDIQTDYLVLGTPPEQPTPLGAAAPPSAQALYSQQMEKYQQYEKIVQQAHDLNVPVLTMNKFLDFVGYAPGAAPVQ